MSESAQPESQFVERLEAEAWLDMYAAAPEEYAQRHGLRVQRLGPIALLACPKLPSTEFNRALCIGVEARPSPETLAQVTEWLTTHGEAWALQCPPSALEDATLRDWLAGSKLQATGTGWTKFRRGATVPTAIATDMTVRLAGPAEADAFGRVAQAGFGLPSHTAAWFAELVRRPRWRAYLAYDRDTPVAAGALFHDGERGWLGIDATLPGYRRRGAQSALIAARVADGLAAGVMAFGAETGNPPTEMASGYSSYRNFCRAGFSVEYVRPNYRLG